MSDYGLGKDTWTVPFDKIIESLRIYAAAEKMYILVVWITKLSILLLYLRLFPDDTVRRNIKIVFVVYAAALFCLFFADLFKCWPISYEYVYSERVVPTISPLTSLAGPICTASNSAIAPICKHRNWQTRS